MTTYVFRLGRRRCFLLSISLSSLLGVTVCLSNSAVVFLLLRLSQGVMLAGVFVSSYIASEYPVHTHLTVVPLTLTLRFLQPYSVIDFSRGLEQKQPQRPQTQPLTSVFILESTLGFLGFALSHLLALCLSKCHGFVKLHLSVFIYFWDFNVYNQKSYIK